MDQNRQEMEFVRSPSERDQDVQDTETVSTVVTYDMLTYARMLHPR